MIANGVQETTDSVGLTPFDWAAAEGNESVLHILHDAKKDANRSMATILAASCGRNEACQVIQTFSLIFQKTIIIPYQYCITNYNILLFPIVIAPGLIHQYFI